jgi:hypothetical protein
MIMNTAMEAELIGRWAEGCPCHGDELLTYSVARRNKDSRQLPPLREEAKFCPYKGCRAPELATGDGLKKAVFQKMFSHVFDSIHFAVLMKSRRPCQVLETMYSSRQAIMDYAVHSAPSSKQQAGQSLASGMLQDWLSARAKIHSDVIMKLNYWKSLPWYICGLGHSEAWRIQSVARRLLWLWDDVACPGRQHAMSRRFLDPNFRGIDGLGIDHDPPLRLYVEQLASGPTF